MDRDLTIEEVDALTGPAIGRAKSATFRTADIAGVDVCVQGRREPLRRWCPHDPQRERLPGARLHEEHGRARAGWARRRAPASTSKDGKEIRTLDWKTLEYRDAAEAEVRLAGRRPRTSPTSAARIAPADGRARTRPAQFLWRVLSATSPLRRRRWCRRSPTTSCSIDRAMEWGYGWGMGPFRTAGRAGRRSAVAERVAGRRARQCPPLVEQLLASGRKTLLRERGRPRHGVRPPGRACRCPTAPGVIDLRRRCKARARSRKKNAGASLVDLGDGVRAWSSSTPR